MKQPDYSYQEPLIENTIKDLKECKKVVLACAPNAGKTNMALRIVERFVKEKASFKTLILCHGQVIIREQWVDRINEIKLSVKYSVINTGKVNKKDLKSNLLFTLPQSFRNIAKNFKIDLLIVDEAHQRYHANEMECIIGHIKPSMQLMLTGSPAIFIEKGGWKINGITLSELLTHNVATDPLIEIVQFNYKMNLKNYLKTGDLSSAYVFNRKQTISSLDLLLSELILKITSTQRTNTDKDKNLSLRKRKWNILLSKLDKTMIVTRNQNQARDVDQYFKDIGVNSILSISDNDSDNGIESFKKFKNDTKSQVLIVVSRGIIGFDYSELFNIIDMSGTCNVDRLFQMLCRAVRISKVNPKKKKMFIKLTNTSMQEITYWTMSYVVALSIKEYYYTQKKYPPLRVSIPVAREFINQIQSTRSLNNEVKAKLILPKLYTFNKMRDISSGLLKTTAFTTLKTVRDKLNNVKVINLDDTIKIIKTCKNRRDFMMYYPSSYGFMLRLHKETLNTLLPVKKQRVTMEYAIALAKTCKDRSELYKKCSSSYRLLHSRKKILDEILPKKVSEYTLRSAMKTGKECKNASDFYKRYPQAYSFIRRKYPDKMRDIFYKKSRKRMFKSDRLKTKYMTLEKAIAIAKTCDTRSNFKLKDPGAAKFLSKHKAIFNKIIPSKRIFWNLPKAIRVAKKCKNRKDFHRRYATAYGLLLENPDVFDKVLPRKKNSVTTLKG